MKKTTGFLLGILLLIGVATVTGKAQDFKPKTETLNGSEKIVTGAPFSAEAISESVQIMFNGNKITRIVKSQLFRDSQGRFRREEMPQPVGIGSFVETSQSIFIFDPVAGVKFYLDSKSKTVRQSGFKLKGNQSANNTSSSSTSNSSNSSSKEDEKPVNLAAKPNPTKTDIKANQAKPSTISKKPNNPQIPALSNNPLIPNLTQGEVKKESLGKRNIEGLEAEGTRLIKTIPAGAIGNEQAFEIVYERWYSKELELIVFSKYTDPRFGEQSYRLTSIRRVEPDSSLFSPPADYKTVSKPSNSGNKKVPL